MFFRYLDVRFLCGFTNADWHVLRQRLLRQLIALAVGQAPGMLL